MGKQVKITQRQRNINSIVGAITVITGLKPIEKITEDKYVLSLGGWDALEIGYDKNKKKMSVDDMRYNALVCMLREVSKAMEHEDAFVSWIRMNNVFINKQN